MASIIKAVLTGSTNNRAIGVSASGVVIHTVASLTTTLDEVYLWAVNDGTQAYGVTVEFGGSNSADKITMSVANQEGPQLMVPGIILAGAATPPVVSSFVTGTNTISILGYVNRIDQS